MSDQPISRAICNWRAAWAYERRKQGLGPTENEDWADYVDDLSMSEVLWYLEFHDA